MDNTQNNTLVKDSSLNPSSISDPQPDKNTPLENSSLSKVFSPQVLGYVVHAMRILTKLGTIFALFYGQSTYAFPLTIYLILSEVFDQALLFLGKKKPHLYRIIPVIYVINSTLAISGITYFANWILNDYYLVYLIHISSATLAYGTRIGLLSFALTAYFYGILLFAAGATPETYLRIPLMGVVILRLLFNQLRYEKANRSLDNILNIEKSKKDFIGIASHNLRTPVAAIYGYLDLLIRGEAGALNEKQLLYLNRVKSNNHELEALTEKLLQISIFEVGEEVNLFKQPSQIEIIIEDVVEKFTSVAKAKGLQLTFQKQPGLLPPVNIDVDRITSVLSNMVDNALKYTEKGSVTVTATKVDEFVAVSVKDTGVSISKEELPKIFNKFYRSGNILVYNQIGTGLGLYLGKKIVELHGGTVSVDSVQGRGSTFTFTIPIAKEKII